MDNRALYYFNEATANFINEHRLDDVRHLALIYGGSSKTVKGEVDISKALDQIQGWQTARKKLPSWASNDGIVYPPHLNMEQCSSERTARYKAGLCGSGELIDLTGGFGVDFSFMSQCFDHAVYVERDERLCAIAEHNFEALGLSNIEVVCGDGVDYLHSINNKSQTTIYLDPARRDIHGHKVYGIEDCTPDVLQLKDELLGKAHRVMIKLSPMLDWHAAVKAFGGCCREVHIVSVGNECKELLLILESRSSGTLENNAPVKIVCVNDDEIFEISTDIPSNVRSSDSIEAKYLYVPNASVMKAGIFAHLTDVFPLAMADRDSHLFLSNEDINGFPGRKFRIVATTTMNKKELRQKLAGIDKANISVRNFPLSAEALRQRLKLKDGGDTYLFATTVHGKHIIYITMR